MTSLYLCGEREGGRQTDRDTEIFSFSPETNNPIGLGPTLITSVSLNYSLKQWSPTFLVPGTGFAEDRFSTGGVGEDGSGGNGSDGERQMNLHCLARHSPPAVRPGS